MHGQQNVKKRQDNRGSELKGRFMIYTNPQFLCKYNFGAGPISNWHFVIRNYIHLLSSSSSKGKNIHTYSIILPTTAHIYVYKIYTLKH